MKYNKYKNIFNYYRGQNFSKGDFDEHYNKQIEDNTTKAFINTLEYLSVATQKEVLKKLGIVTERIKSFDLQPSFKYSRPDAVIRTHERDYFIESKVGSELIIEQLKNHLLYIGNEALLIVITNNAKDADKINKEGLNHKFFTWNDIWLKFNTVKTENKTDSFIINQFLNYLEDNNMCEFNGFKQKDFDAFLFIEDDYKEEARKNVKLRFSSFIDKMKIALKEESVYADIYSKVMKAVRKDTTYVWGNFVKEGKDNIDIAHFWINISANGIDIGIQNEGANSTKQFINKLSKDAEGFTSICKKLDNYKLDLKERYQIQVQNYGIHQLATINLGNNFTINDTQYLISKIKEYKLIELTFYKHYNRDDKSLEDIGVINVFKDEFVKLADLYRFNQK